MHVALSEISVCPANTPPHLYLRNVHRHCGSVCVRNKLYSQDRGGTTIAAQVCSQITLLCTTVLLAHNCCRDDQDAVCWSRFAGQCTTISTNPMWTLITPSACGFSDECIRFCERNRDETVRNHQRSRRLTQITCAMRVAPEQKQPRNAIKYSWSSKQGWSRRTTS